MSKVKTFGIYELKPEANREEFESFCVNEFLPQWEELPGLLQSSLFRCERGGLEKHAQAWPSWGEAGQVIEQWIAAHQALWDKLFTFVDDAYPLSEDDPVYVEVGS
jgi:hypothetical protein